LIAIVEQKNSNLTPFYIHTDYMGNYNFISNSSGEIIEQLSFDPWGRRRNPQDWSAHNVPTTFLFDRGYSGHEHLDELGLINMNGRMYDPALARFLSPDPFLSDPTNSQEHNRYSYCLNNPLTYTDPSGYKPLFDPWYGDSPVIWNPGGGSGGNSFGGGLIGPGSNHHWSDQKNYRTEWGHFMLMSSSTFINVFGQEKYNVQMLLGGYIKNFDYDSPVVYAEGSDAGRLFETIINNGIAKLFSKTESNKSESLDLPSSPEREVLNNNSVQMGIDVYTLFFNVCAWCNHFNILETKLLSL